MIYLKKVIDGVEIQFRIKHQFRSGNLPAKIIDVTDGVGFGPTLTYASALAFARRLANDPHNAKAREKKRAAAERQRPRRLPR